MLKQRLLTAFVLIPIVLTAIFFLSTLQFAVFTGIFVSLGAWEWAQLCDYRSVSFKITYLSLIIVILIISFLARNTQFPQVLIALNVLWWIFFIYLLIRYQHGKKTCLDHKQFRAVIGGVMLVPTWLSLVMLHLGRSNGAALIFFLFLLIWLADSAAYFCGRQWGKIKLASAVSPGKTWEGVYGSLLISAAAAVIFALATGMQVPDIIVFSIISLITVAGSVLGDLNESMIKRLANVKDSGAIFPGHGGVMDRIDSLTAAAPIYVAFLTLTEVLRP